MPTRATTRMRSNWLQIGALVCRVIATATSHLQVFGPRRRNGAAIKLRLVESSLRLLHGARRRRTQGACSSLPLALGCKVLAAAATRHQQVVGFATETAIKLRLIESSLRLLHGVRPRRTQGACSSLPLALEWSAWRCINKLRAGGCM